MALHRLVFLYLTSLQTTVLSNINFSLTQVPRVIGPPNTLPPIQIRVSSPTIKVEILRTAS